ncbi:MAG: hypothetical protein ACC707_18845 [Thiohalomonadales bacterium]
MKTIEFLGKKYDVEDIWTSISADLDGEIYLFSSDIWRNNDNQAWDTSGDFSSLGIVDRGYLTESDTSLDFEDWRESQVMI